MGKSDIAYVTHGWPVTLGCTKLSEACLNCYAETLYKLWGRDFTPRENPKALAEFDSRKKPARIFVSPTSDLFHKAISDEYLTQVFDRIHTKDKLTYLVLTKRPGRMAKFANNRNRTFALQNVWEGTTAENQQMWDERTEFLKCSNLGRITWVSVAPMLGPIKIEPSGFHPDWVVIESESGTSRRPTDPNWVLDLINQCTQFGIKVYLKQLEIGGKLVIKPEFMGRQWLELPE